MMECTCMPIRCGMAITELLINANQTIMTIIYVVIIIMYVPVLLSYRWKRCDTTRYSQLSLWVL